MATALTPQTDVTPGKSRDWWRTRDRKENRLKTQLNIFFNFYFIKSETSDSFVNHFDGHFAYLKTLDFYFNVSFPLKVSCPRYDLAADTVLLSYFCLWQVCCVFLWRTGWTKSWWTKHCSSFLNGKDCASHRTAQTFDDSFPSGGRFLLASAVIYLCPVSPEAAVQLPEWSRMLYLCRTSLNFLLSHVLRLHISLFFCNLLYFFICMASAWREMKYLPCNVRVHAALAVLFLSP